VGQLDSSHISGQAMRIGPGAQLEFASQPPDTATTTSTPEVQQQQSDFLNDQPQAPLAVPPQHGAGYAPFARAPDTAAAQTEVDVARSSS
jgi:hypothetical protein